MLGFFKYISNLVIANIQCKNNNVRRPDIKSASYTHYIFICTAYSKECVILSSRTVLKLCLQDSSYHVVTSKPLCDG